MIKDELGIVPAAVCSSVWQKRKGWVQTGDRGGFVVLSRDMSSVCSAEPEGSPAGGGEHIPGHRWFRVHELLGGPCPQLLMESIEGVQPPGVALAGQPPDAASAALIYLGEKAISRLGWQLTLFTASFVNFWGCFSATTVTSSGQLDFSGKRTNHSQS